MKVLITGGAGFIGSNIAKLLQQNNYEIVVFDDFSTGYRKNLDEFPDVELIVGDVRDKSSLSDAMKDCDTVFHLAASIGNVNSLRDPVKDSQINVLGTLNVLEAAKLYGVRRIVYSSSAAIFGELQYQPIDEKHPVEPDSPYGVSKLAAEKHCLWFSRTYDLEIVCLRYFNAYGINQRYDEYGNVIPIWATLLLQNKPITIYGDGEQTRDFVNVKDIALANVLAAKEDGLSGAFNIGCGKSITINKLASMLKDVTNRDMDVVYAPPRKGEVLHCLADVSLAQTSFGFNPSTDMYDNLVEYVEWMSKDGMSVKTGFKDPGTKSLKIENSKKNDR